MSLMTSARQPARAGTDSPVLTIRDLSVSYGEGKPSVSGVSLEMARGEILGLIGESGSGKSTVAMGCAGLLPGTAKITAETFQVCGEDVLSLDRGGWRKVRGAKVGTIFQDAMGALDPSMRIGNQLAEVVARHQGLSGRERRRAVIELMGRVGVPEPEKRARQYSFQLSGGLRQRVAIALALGGDPDLLLADEPTTALDVTVQAGILELFRNVRDEFGVGVLLISHDMGVIAQTADRVGVMYQGEIVEYGAVNDVLLHPQADYTRGLLTAMPRFTTRTDLGVQKADTEPIIEVRDLAKTFRLRGQEVAAVRGVSLDLRRGEVLSIVGESGSGKSTLARMIAGLERPTSGEIAIDGKVVHSTKAGRDGRLQMVFQHPLGSLNPRLRVGTSIREPLGRGVPAKQAQERVLASASAVSLPRDAVQRFPHEFSGGQAQRVAVARAMVARPEVVVLDEPTSALDVSVQAQILTMLRELKERDNLTYLFISHDLAVVRQISDRVAVMYAGEVVEFGDAEQIFSNPQHWYTKALLAAVPSPDPREHSARPVVAPAGSAGSWEGVPSCGFATRCAHAEQLCRTVRPTLTELKDEGGSRTHLVACHHPSGAARV